MSEEDWGKQKLNEPNRPKLTRKAEFLAVATARKLKFRPTLCLFYFILFWFCNCIVPFGFHPWKIWVVFPRGKSAAIEPRYPTYGACWMFQCFNNPPNSNTYCRIFDVCTDVNLRGCTREYTDNVRESAQKVDSGRKIPCRTEESNLRQRRAGPMLYQLSYVPTQCLAEGISDSSGFSADRTLYFCIRWNPVRGRCSKSRHGYCLIGLYNAELLLTIPLFLMKEDT